MTLPVRRAHTIGVDKPKEKEAAREQDLAEYLLQQQRERPPPRQHEADFRPPRGGGPRGESECARSYYPNQEDQKTCYLWLLTIWLLTVLLFMQPFPRLHIVNKCLIHPTWIVDAVKEYLLLALRATSKLFEVDALIAHDNF